MEQSTHEPLVDARKVAEYLGTSRAYVLRLALLGAIPSVALPAANGDGLRRHWRFSMADVRAWQRQRQVKARRSGGAA